MSRKDLTQIALALLKARPTLTIDMDDDNMKYAASVRYDIEIRIWKNTVRSIADACNSSSERFNMDLFLETCGYN